MATLWHALDVASVIAKLESAADGLSDAEAARRLAEVGPNRLVLPPTASIAAILIAQLRSVMVVLLVAAVVIALASGDRLDALAIGAVLVINTLIGFVTELRARRAMEALLQLDEPRALVVRGGRRREIDARELVPGDVIELEAAHQVAADARLLQSDGLTADEAPLTGESLPVAKEADVTLLNDTPLAERRTMVYKGTMLTTGAGRAIVTATGGQTEVGRIGALVGSVAVEATPLERQLDRLGRRLVWLVLGVAALVAGLGSLHGMPIALAIQTALALAVAAVPEALPAVATIALAVGVHRMARRNALVRRLSAVEALGAATVICTDKTGTLTSGRMSVIQIWADDQDWLANDLATHDAASPATRVLEAAALASQPPAEAADGAAAAHGEPEDAAIVEAAIRAGIDRAALVGAQPQIALLPFSSDRKLMASFHRVDGRTVAYAKGAPRAIVQASARRSSVSGDAALDESGRVALLRINEQLAARGLRVLAVAAGTVESSTPAALTGLTFLGFVGLADPPAPAVRETIARLRSAGLRVIMLTGDQRVTAEAVGRSLGLVGPDQDVVDGRELERTDTAAVAAIVSRAAAFSRVTPEHKIAVIRTLRASGEIVAMIGDGINDAPALKQADIGVAMGRRGTDVAKQAASIVLADDRFDTIGAAVEEGRVVFENIRKFVFYLFSCNVAEVLVVFGASVAGLPAPLQPLQLLWLNIVTDTFPALSLAVEPGESDVMQRPPRRPDEAVMSRPFVRDILLYATLITAVTLSAFLWALSHAPERATTITFMTLALAQVAHLGNARRAAPVLSRQAALGNPYAVFGALISVVLQVAAVSIPSFRTILHVTPLELGDWVVVLAAASAPAVVGQVAKLKGRRLPQRA